MKNFCKKILEKLKKTSRYTRVIAILWLVIIFLNLLAQVPAFCDFYTDHLFRFLATPLCMIFGCTTLPLGEACIVLAILFTLASLVLGIILIFLRKKEKYKRFAVKWLKSYLAFFVLVAMLMTLNCSIPYGCNTMKINEKDREEYGFDELLILRNYLAQNANELYRKVAHDANGYAVFDAEKGQDLSKELIKECQKAMKGIADDYPRLSGYYPNPKCMMGSVFMYQTGIIGVYFPFSMESYYSRYLAQAQFPATICHEFSHLKGYMFENEANFIAYIACMNSDNDFVKYSGYINALDYIDFELLCSISSEEEYYRYENECIEIEEGIFNDYSSYTKETRTEAQKSSEKVTETTGVSAEKINEIGDSFSQGYADYYEVELNYSDVTLCLLKYFDGVLY